MTEQSWSTFLTWHTPLPKVKGAGVGRGGTMWKMVDGIQLRVASILYAWPKKLCVTIRMKEIECVPPWSLGVMPLDLSSAKSVIHEFSKFPLPRPRTLFSQEWRWPSQCGLRSSRGLGGMLWTGNDPGYRHVPFPLNERQTLSLAGWLTSRSPCLHKALGVPGTPRSA